MKSVNVFVITGNVTKDVELRHTKGGTATATYLVAVDDVYYDSTGTKREETDFFPITTYGTQAENDAKYLKKGMLVVITGRMKSWYRREENRGGINFVPQQVQYIGRPGQRPAAPAAGDERPAIDDWTRDYDRQLAEEQAGAGNPAPSAAQ